ncbi:MAG: hypothetical protein RLZZ416_832 [Candidatus Parcubacteria bacterium]|jgi:voltage-gated potassium channel Kch
MLPFFYTFYRFGKSVWRTLRDPEFEVVTTLAALVLAIGTLSYHGLEGWSYLDSLYFSVTTLTTIGFGDLSPHTEVGKIFTIAYVIVGIGILLGFINAVALHTIEEGKRDGVLLPKRFRIRHVKTGEVEEEELVA